MSYITNLVVFICFVCVASGGYVVFDDLEATASSSVSSSSALTPTDQAAFGSWDARSMFDVSFKGSDANVTRVHVVLYHVDVEPKVSVLVTGKRYYCCTEEMREALAAENQPLCEYSDIPLVNRSAMSIEERWNFYYWSIGDGRTPVANRDYTQGANLTSSAWAGVWRLRLLNCKVNSTVKVSGKILWQNPWGYLSASQFGLMPTYIVLTILYGLMTAWWAYISWKNSQKLVKLQLCIGFVIVLSFLDNMLLAIDWGVYNDSTGTIATIFNIVSVAFTTVRSVAAFSLMLLVALGWQVYLERLERPYSLYYGVYVAMAFVVTLIWAIVEMMGYTPELSAWAAPIWVRVTFTVLVTMIDFGFLAGTILALTWTIHVLKENKQTVKLSIFKSLLVVICVASVVAAINFIAQAAVMLGDLYYDLVSGVWAFEAIWQFLYFFVLLLIAHLLRPTNSNQRLNMVQLSTVDTGDAHYKEEIDEDDDAAVPHDGVGASSDEDDDDNVDGDGDEEAGDGDGGGGGRRRRGGRRAR